MVEEDRVNTIFDLQNLKVLKFVTNQKKKLMNKEQQIHGNIVSPLFKLLD
jgi:hypothetical protein